MIGAENTSVPRVDVSIVVPTRDRLLYLKSMVASVPIACREHSFEIIVIDGDSTDGTAEWLEANDMILQPTGDNVVLVDGKETWGSFINRGIRTSRGEFVALLSDDCLLAPGSLDEGINRARSGGNRCGAVAFAWRDWPYEKRFRIGRTFGDLTFVNHGLYRREALDDVGLCDATSYRFYCADGDLALRLWQAGWVVRESSECVVEHFAHANSRLRRANVSMSTLDWRTYEERWGHLGTPVSDWVYFDSHATGSMAREYWGARRLLRMRATASRILRSVQMRGRNAS